MKNHVIQRLASILSMPTEEISSAINDLIVDIENQEVDVPEPDTARQMDQTQTMAQLYASDTFNAQASRTQVSLDQKAMLGIMRQDQAINRSRFFLSICLSAISSGALVAIAMILAALSR